MQSCRANTIAAAAIVAAPVFPAAAGAQSETVLYNFRQYADPVGHLVLDKTTGILYGLTYGYSPYTYLTAFSLKEKGGVWKYSALYTFSDETSSLGGLIEDSAGALYGTTYDGGSHHYGSVFQLVRQGTTWTEVTLYNFLGGADGALPIGELFIDRVTGTIYGTTDMGGTSEGCGIVFQLTKSGRIWTESVLHAFRDGTDGCRPETNLREDSGGGLYGGTYEGGIANAGVVFKLTESQGEWKENVIYSFAGGSDGVEPTDVDLDQTTGNLFGITDYGGSSNAGCVFELAKVHKSWKESVLYSFAGGSDGSSGVGLHLDQFTGTMYGTTQGAAGIYGEPGTIFQLVQSGSSWTETVLHHFRHSRSDGRFPDSRPTEDRNTGTLYGLTAEGGTYGWGTAYMVQLPRGR